MGMTITNFWGIFCYGVKRENDDKFVVRREFSEQLALECFNNIFLTDNGTIDENMPLLDEVNDEDPVVTHRHIYFSLPSLIPHIKLLFMNLLSPVFFHQPLLCLPSLFVYSTLFKNQKLNREVNLTGIKYLTILEG